MLDKIQIYICIIAALVIGVVSILQNTPLIVMAVRLIAFIVSFYIIGLIVRFYLRKKVFLQPEPSEEILLNEDNENESEDSGIALNEKEGEML